MMCLKRLAVVSLSLLVSVAAAHADTFHTHNTGTWNDVNDWTQNGNYPASRLPGSADGVYIDHDFEMDVDVTLAYLNVSTDKTLTIDSSKTLTISYGVDIGVSGTLVVGGTLTLNFGTVSNGMSVDGALVIDGGTLNTSSSVQDRVVVVGSGSIIMQGASPEIVLNATDAIELLDGAILEADPSNSVAWLTGSGSLKGYNADTLIRIHDDSILALFATLHGAMTVQKGTGSGTPALYNLGVVNADASSQALVLDSTIDLFDDLAKEWRSSGDGYLLVLTSPSGTLSGDFIAGGTIAFGSGVSLTTDGYASLLSGGAYDTTGGIFGPATFAYFGIGSDPCEVMPANGMTDAYVSCP